MRWKNRRTSANSAVSGVDEERWAGTTVGDPLASDETSPPPTKRSAFREFVHRFLTPKWTASETLTEKTWEEEMEEYGRTEGRRRTSIDDYKGQFSWVVVDNNLKDGPKQEQPGGAKGNVEIEEEIRRHTFPPGGASTRTPSITSARPTAGSALQRFFVDGVWPIIKAFAHMTFPDRQQERTFQHEVS